ncbi:DUF6193 family natural product biosynthesis protein [Streptomyces sp. NPDC053541]|uniref:DUF6193 family natural product biosynthesis protein n=1 Tax=Streptomyces sp. NPDC053541 TaxID=3365709 RepID=UPI0037CE2554
MTKPSARGASHSAADRSTRRGRQPIQPSPALYPDLAAAGSLSAALAQCAAENALDVGEVRSSSGSSSLIHAVVTSRNPRLDRFSVHLGAAERVFLVSAWGQGVHLTNGSTNDLTELAAAAAAWRAGATLAQLQAAAPFLTASPLALAHERGAEYAVAEKWGCYLTADTHWDQEMLRAAHAEPRLRALFPYTSHAALMFSRCTGSPFSRDVSTIHPLGDHRYAVHHRGEPFSTERVFTAQEAAAEVVARMPATWGPAVAGTRHDLRDRESQ